MVPMEIEAAAVIRVATRPGHDIDGAVARQAAGQIEVDRGDLEFLDDILGNLKENANRSRGADAGAVDRHAGRSDTRNRLKAATERRDEHATVGQPRRVGHPGLQLRELQEVPSVQRQPFDLVPRHHTADLMVIVANQRLGPGDRHALGHLAELERQVDGRRRSRLDDRLTIHLLEAACFASHRIHGGRQRSRTVMAFAGCRERPAEARRAIHDADVCSGHRRTGRIGDETGNRARRRLRTSGADRHQDQKRNECRRRASDQDYFLNAAVQPTTTVTADSDAFPAGSLIRKR